MRLADIHASLERMFGHPVSMESLAWTLRVGLRSKHPKFERVHRGYYRALRTK